MEFDFEKSIKLCLNAMRLARIHPEIHLDLKWALQFGLCFGTFTIIMLLMVYNAYNDILLDNFSEACRNGILCLTYFGAGFNTFLMLHYRTPIKVLLDMMRNDYRLAKKQPLEEQKILAEYVKKKTYICKLWFVMCVLSLGLFNGKALILMLYYYIIGEPKLVNLFDMKFPTVIEERKDELAIFLLIYAILLFYGVYACVMYMSFVPFGPVLMLHACGHLEVIKKHIDSLFVGDPGEVNHKLNEIVQKMQYTYNFVDIVKDRFKSYYEANLTLSSFSLPFTFYELLQSIGRGEFSLEFSSFMASGLLLSSTPCYYSDLLLKKGEEVRVSLYTCGWESHYDRRVRSTILLLLLRSARPIALRTMFRTLCLDALSNILELAYRIFSLMNAMLD